MGKEKEDITHLTGLGKIDAIQVLQSKSSWSSREVVHILSTMKFTVARQPRYVKVGDVFFHKGLRHFAIVIKCVKKRDEYICVLTTSNEECVANVDKCRSRFFDEGFITLTMTKCTKDEIVDSYVFNYDNKKHISEIRQKLTNVYKNSEML